MKTLQTILGSLALAGAVIVPVSQSNAESLDSLVGNKASRVELMQDKKEKTVAEQIFDSYKGKIIRVVTKDATKPGSELEAIYEISESMTGGLKKYPRVLFPGFDSKGLGSREGLYSIEKDSVLLFGNFWNSGVLDDSTGMVETRKLYLKVSQNLNSKDSVSGDLIYATEKELVTLPNFKFTINEISKKEYEEIEKFRKGIIGKFEAKTWHRLENGKKTFLNIDKKVDFTSENEVETTCTKTDPETGKKTIHKIYVDKRHHLPLEIEFNDKGEMTYNSSKYKNPYKTRYALDLANNVFYYRTAFEFLKVVPENFAETFKKKLDEQVLFEKLTPIFEPDGTMSLEYHIKYADSMTDVYCLKKVK